MKWWNFLNAAFEIAHRSKFVFILPHLADSKLCLFMNFACEKVQS